MPQVVDSIPALLEELSERLRHLERRVTVLESAAALPKETVIPNGAAESRDPSGRIGSSGTDAASATPSRQRFVAGLQTPSGIFPTLGKAVLGLSGAFLLRALAESGSLPKLPILFIAILYAFSWMLWATQPSWLVAPSRVSKQASSERFASATYTVTSALILSPLLWEGTLRFQVLSATIASIVLVAFIAITLALSASRNLQLIPWIATLSSLATAVALIIATRELVPLTVALLAIALATEISVCSGHQLTFRIIPAVVADFGVWLLISILASDAVPEGYHAVPRSTIVLLSAVLPTIYVASIALRSFVQLHRVTVMDITQSAVAFALATYGIMRATQNASAWELGTVFLLLAAFCYWGALSRFADDVHSRNRRVSASWAAALLASGTLFVVPTHLQIPVLCLAAVLTAIIYIRTAKTSLGLHASFYIVAAVAVSAMPTYVGNALAGIVPATAKWPVWTVALAAALCYAIESHGSNDQGRRRLLWIVPASVVAFAMTAWTITAIVLILGARVELAASHLSMIRTIVICGFALALGFASCRRHIELGWIAYAAVALGTLKLLFEDLRFGNPASLVVSFLFYGMVLILLPRLTKEPISE
jgi:hypothetical protein